MVVVILLCAGTLFAPRRYVVVPMLIAACCIPPSQRVVVVTLDFHCLRILVLAGLLRITMFSEHRGFKSKPIDTLVVLWALASTAALTLNHGTLEAFINRLGMMFEALGMYFLFRITIRDYTDVKSIVRLIALLVVPVAMAFVLEHSSGRNIFSVFGGVPEETIIRFGRLRCQGPFPHPIMAGCFWVALTPLIASLWYGRGTDRYFAAAGLAGSSVVILMCASATPLGGALAVALALAIFPLRRWLSWIRYATVGLIIMVQLLMISPIWHLMARFSLVEGSSGWYRSRIIDDFIIHFRQWCLIGTDNYESWLPLGHADITNHYILQGLEGGAITLMLFVAIITAAFVAVGRTLRSSRRRAILRQGAGNGNGRRGNSVARAAITWALGVSLLAHCVLFMGTSYFGQPIMIWYLTLAMIGSLAPAGRTRGPVLRLRETQFGNDLPSRRTILACSQRVGLNQG